MMLVSRTRHTRVCPPMYVYIGALIFSFRATSNTFIPSRKLTAPEAKGALVTFYRAVHPDLFHSYPQHKVRAYVN